MNKYTHEVLMYISNSDVLVCHVMFDINSLNSTSVKKIAEFVNLPDFGIDSISVNLFDNIINGKVKHTYIDSDMNKYTIEINEKDILKNIEKYISLQDEYFAVKIKLLKIKD